MKGIIFVIVYLIIMYGISQGIEKYADKRILQKMKERYRKTDWKELTYSERSICEAGQIIIETFWNLICSVALLIIMLNIYYQ